jgi:hypothetical protein
MTKCRVRLMSRAMLPKTIAPHPVGAPLSDFILVDNQNASCTVLGVDAAGNPTDISGVATLTVTSPTPGTISVGPITGMTYNLKAMGPLVTGLQIVDVATWNDGSIGPFSFIDPCDVVTGPTTGLQINHGVPVSN